MNARTKEKRSALIDGSSFWALVSMLLSNRFKVDFREDKKKSWGRLILLALGFGVITSLFYLFYFLTAQLNIFSALIFVPLSVPSIISSVLLLFGFLSLSKGLTEDLYFSK